MLVAAYYLPGGPALPDQAETLVEVEGDAASGAPRSWFQQLVLGKKKRLFKLDNNVIFSLDSEDLIPIAGLCTRLLKLDSKVIVSLDCEDLIPIADFAQK